MLFFVSNVHSQIPEWKQPWIYPRNVESGVDTCDSTSRWNVCKLKFMTHLLIASDLSRVEWLVNYTLKNSISFGDTAIVLVFNTYKDNINYGRRSFKYVSMEYVSIYNLSKLDTLQFITQYNVFSRRKGWVIRGPIFKFRFSIFRSRKIYIKEADAPTFTPQEVCKFIEQPLYLDYSGSHRSETICWTKGVITSRIPSVHPVQFKVLQSGLCKAL
jgi:hypothetical protein